MLVVGVPIVAGGISRHRAFSVMLGAITFVPVRWVLHAPGQLPCGGLSEAVQLKLDELIRAAKGAHNALPDVGGTAG